MNNPDDYLYKTTKLVYDVIRESGGKSPNVADIRKKYFNLSNGLSAEDEFIALCLWSGKCSLVHKLDTSVRPKHSGYGVPDLLCVFDHGGRQVPVLIEVKSSIRDKFPLSSKYCNELKKYSDALNLPLLIAFRWNRLAHPTWCLFEFDNMRTPRGSFTINMPGIFKHDLTGLLLGNFHIQLLQGTTISMTITKEQVYSDDNFAGTLVDINWESPDGTRIDPSWLLQWLFILTDDEVEIEDYPDRIVQRFKKLNDESAMAYWALPSSLPIERYRVGGQINWSRLVEENEFSFSLQDLRDAAKSGDGAVRYIMDQVPTTMPTFL